MPYGSYVTCRITRDKYVIKIFIFPNDHHGSKSNSVRERFKRYNNDFSAIPILETYSVCISFSRLPIPFALESHHAYRTFRFYEFRIV